MVLHVRNTAGTSLKEVIFTYDIASYVKPGQPAKLAAKPNIDGAKVMLCIWWDQKGVLYYELLKPGETINGKRYRSQLIRLKRAIAEKRPEYATRHEPAQFFWDGIHKCQGQE